MFCFTKHNKHSANTRFGRGIKKTLEIKAFPPTKARSQITFLDARLPAENTKCVRTTSASKTYQYEATWYNETNTACKGQKCVWFKIWPSEKEIIQTVTITSNSSHSDPARNPTDLLLPRLNTSFSRNLDPNRTWNLARRRATHSGSAVCLQIRSSLWPTSKARNATIRLGVEGGRKKASESETKSRHL